MQGYPPSYNANSILKISYQPSPQTKIVGLYSARSKLEEQEAATTFRPFESTHNYKFDPRIYKGEVQQTLSNNVLFTNHLAFMPYWANRRIQDGVDLPGNPSRFDIATQWFTGPAPTPNNYYKDNLELQGNIQFYQVFGSRHDLKLGYLKDWSYTGYNRYNHEAGNYQLRFDNGAPLQIITYNYPLIAKRESAMQSFAAYVQDTWTTTSRLTINAGLRLEQFHNYVLESTKEQGQFGSAGEYPAMDLQTWWGLRRGWERLTRSRAIRRPCSRPPMASSTTIPPWASPRTTTRTRCSRQPTAGGISTGTATTTQMRSI